MAGRFGLRANKWAEKNFQFMGNDFELDGVCNDGGPLRT